LSQRLTRDDLGAGAYAGHSTRGVTKTIAFPRAALQVLYVVDPQPHDRVLIARDGEDLFNLRDLRGDLNDVS